MVMGSVLWTDEVGLGLARNIVQRYALETGSEQGFGIGETVAQDCVDRPDDAAFANSPLAVKRFPKAGSRPGRRTRLEKPAGETIVIGPVLIGQHRQTTPITLLAAACKNGFDNLPASEGARSRSRP
jgi:hypothetical protein